MLFSHGVFVGVMMFCFVLCVVVEGDTGVSKCF